MNILIPMAGHGSRFAKVGFVEPKPLIPVLGKTMIEVVIDNLRPSEAHRFIFVCQAAHVREHQLDEVLRRAAPGCEIIEIDGVTEGAACTCLTAASLINSDRPLMIANCDQYLDLDINAYVQAALNSPHDGLIMTMTAHDAKWSFLATDKRGLVTRVVEKQVISDQATVGLYNFRRGADFVQAAERMIARDERVNGEFYVAPTYNELIAQGRSIAPFHVGPLSETMYGLGTPEDLADFKTRFAKLLQ